MTSPEPVTSSVGPETGIPINSMSIDHFVRTILNLIDRKRDALAGKAQADRELEQAQHELREAQARASEALTKDEVTDRDIEALKQEVKHQTGLDFVAVQSLLTVLATPGSMSPRSQPAILPSVFPGQSRPDSVSASMLGFKRPAAAEDEVRDDTRLESQNKQAQGIETAETQLGNQGVDLPDHEVMHSLRQPRPDNALAATVPSNSQGSRERVITTVRNFIHDRQKRDTISLNELDRLAATVVQVFFTVNVLVRLVWLHLGLHYNYQNDPTAALNHPCLASLPTWERDGRCGLSLRLVQAIYSAFGVSVDPRLIPLRRSSHRANDSVQYILSLLFDEPAPSSTDYPGNTYAYRDVLTVIRQELPPPDREIFEAHLKANTTRYLSFLPSIHRNSMLIPSVSAKKASCSPNPDAEGSSLSSMSPSTSKVQRLTWHATCFDAATSKEEVRFNLQEIQKMPQRDDSDELMEDSSRELFQDATEHIIIWSPVSAAVEADMGKNPLIYDHELLYGSLSIREDPIVSFVG